MRIDFSFCGECHRRNEVVHFGEDMDELFDFTICNKCLTELLFFGHDRGFDRRFENPIPDNLSQ